MPNTIPKAIVDYISEQIDHFADESRRLGSRVPLEEFKAITDEFFRIQNSLGTLEHEVALDALKKQVFRCRDDIKSGIAAMWREFVAMRRRASELQKEEAQHKLDSAQRLADFEKSVNELKSMGSPAAHTGESALLLMKNAEKLNLDFADVWKKTSWTHLLIDLRLVHIYFQYFFARTKVLMLFHGFIFVVPIALLGIGYSFASKTFIEILSENIQGFPGLAIVLLVLMYVLKKYYIDKKLKKLQISLEKRLYQSLSSRLLLARTVALQYRILRQGRAD